MTLPVLAVISFLHLPFITTSSMEPFTKTADRRIGRFVGIDNYTTVISDLEFWQSLTNSLIYAVCVVPLQALPLLPSSSCTCPASAFFRALYYLPAISSLGRHLLAWRYSTGAVPSITAGLVGP